MEESERNKSEFTSFSVHDGVHWDTYMISLKADVNDSFHMK